MGKCAQTLPGRYHGFPVRITVREVRRGRWGMKNIRDMTVIKASSQLLVDVGITIARYQKGPHILVVFPILIHRSGAKLEDF